MNDLPLTPGDLRDVADALEQLEAAEAIVANPLFGRIEVYRPGGDDVIGFFDRAGLPEDVDERWYGFKPNGSGASR